MMISHPQPPPAGDRGNEAWFDELTMTDYQLKACPEPVEGPTKIALDLELG